MREKMNARSDKSLTEMLNSLGAPAPVGQPNAQGIDLAKFYGMVTELTIQNGKLEIETETALKAKADVEGQLAAAKQQLEGFVTQVQTVKDNAAQVQAGLTAQIDELKTNVQKAEAAKADSLAKEGSLKMEKSDLETKLAKAVEDLKAAQEQIEALNAEVEQLKVAANIAGQEALGIKNTGSGDSLKGDPVASTEAPEVPEVEQPVRLTTEQAFDKYTEFMFVFKQIQENGEPLKVKSARQWQSDFEQFKVEYAAELGFK